MSDLRSTVLLAGVPSVTKEARRANEEGFYAIVICSLCDGSRESVSVADTGDNDGHNKNFSRCVLILKCSSFSIYDYILYLPLHMIIQAMVN
jgi:hypothetical protein